MSTDTQHRRLAHALFDALEAGDVDGVAACYAPEMTMWANFTMTESSREENLAAIRAGKAMLRRRTYDDRQIHTFHDGFVAQYTCTVVTHQGKRIPLASCLVGTVHGGKIVKLMEYTDSRRFR
jgi:ketosteroid isomerase-like protein